MGGMANPNRKQIEQIRSTEAEAQALIAENEPLLERATPATLGRIILHGGEIASRLSDEIVTAMGERAGVLKATTEAINDDKTPPARIQELEEERMRLQASSPLESTKKETFEALSDVIQRAITLRQEREESSDEPVVDLTHVFLAPEAMPEQSKRGFWQRLFGK